MKKALVPLLTMMVCVVVSAQERPGKSTSKSSLTVGPAIGLSTLPLWPDDGVLTAELERYHVFVEYMTGDLVVSYPVNSSASSRAVVRVRLPNKAEPTIAARVKRGSDGLFRYDYRIRNGANGADPITAWQLDVPTLAGAHLLAPHAWTARTWSRLANTDALFMPAPGSHYIHWELIQDSQPRPSDPVDDIPPASSRSGFAVISPARPGLVKAYFTAGAPRYEADPASFPAQVKAELTAALSMQRTGASALTVGPKFPPDLSTAVLLDDFIVQVQTLHRAHVLDETSSFTAGVLAAINKGRAGGSTRNDTLLALSQIDTAPVGAVEQLMATALRAVTASNR